eukprot:8336020-Lingulodinium_polyedra.AAC.1
MTAPVVATEGQRIEARGTCCRTRHRAVLQEVGTHTGRARAQHFQSQVIVRALQPRVAVRSTP